jgi:hypothetical protein
VPCIGFGLSTPKQIHNYLPVRRREGSDMKYEEMTQKNAALWIQYSSLSIGRSNGTELLDNGGYATVPVRMADGSQKHCMTGT